MQSLFLSPHCDDEVLFGAYTLMRHRPHVVTCFAPHVQEARGGPDYDTRVWETKMALHTLGIVGWDLLPVRDDEPDVEALEACLEEYAERSWKRVFAPAVEQGGHEQHSLLGEMAGRLFPNVTFYLTYRRGVVGRSRSRREVPFEATWPAAKFKAMSAYHSQINLDNTRPWFSGWDREWYA